MTDRKTLTFYRGQSDKNFTCTNGDVYDSSAILEKSAEFGPVDIWHTEYANTDSTVKGANGEEYKGGKLAKGEYYGIVGYRAAKPGQEIGKRVIKLFQVPKGFDMAKITKADDLSVKMMTLPSDIPNPNHHDQYIIQYCQIHSGGVSWDYSHGCLTIYRNSPHDDWQRLMDILVDNEIINITLT